MGTSDDAAADERLVREALSGEDEAFAGLVRRHKRKVFAIARRFARDRSEVEDLCQETFVKAYRDLGKFRGDAPFEHWLSRITVHTCYDALRKRRREEGNVPLDAVAFSLADREADGDLSPERARAILFSAMTRLSAKERLVITLLELEEKPVREVAALTGWSEGNVKVRAHRARKALKKILEAGNER
jgi:RNA polymerase sigma-70 factor (ECF subfamily)